VKRPSTLDFYAREAEAYATSYAVSEELAAFLALLPPGSRILELGCGGGQDSEAMIAAGFNVRPTDGSPELAREAEKRLGCPVDVLLFEDIAFVDEFDAVWANACLLHVPKPSISAVLGKIHRALRTGGVLYASFKTSGEEITDQYGRYYNYPDKDFLRGALGGNWSSVKMIQRTAPGYYNLPADWLHVTALKA
jgi:cyclopropane fatty-acyl-phospholipid synthase-like methyltransferase